MDYQPPPLNKKQKRIHELKNQLDNSMTEHLNTFLDGVAEIEPPKYRDVDGVVMPSLVQIKLKEGANVLDLGNVYFSEDNVTRRVKMSIEKGRLKTIKLDPLPEDSLNPPSNPIHAHFVKGMEALWKAKYQWIRDHCDTLNLARSFMHNSVKIVPRRRSVDGQIFDLSGGNNSQSVTNSLKRANGQIERHPCNKRTRVGLESITDLAKCETVDKMPVRIKIELFDAVMNATVPKLDNVMTGAWNAVYVYEHIGSQFPDLHTAMADLRSALVKFEAANGDKKKIKDEAKAQGIPKKEAEDVPPVIDLLGYISESDRSNGCSQSPAPSERTIHDGIKALRGGKDERSHFNERQHSISQGARDQPNGLVVDNATNGASPAPAVLNPSSPEFKKPCENNNNNSNNNKFPTLLKTSKPIAVDTARSTSADSLFHDSPPPDRTQAPKPSSVDLTRSPSVHSVRSVHSTQSDSLFIPERAPDRSTPSNSVIRNLFPSQSQDAQSRNSAPPPPSGPGSSRSSSRRPDGYEGPPPTMHAANGRRPSPFTTAPSPFQTARKAPAGTEFRAHEARMVSAVPEFRAQEARMMGDPRMVDPRMAGAWEGGLPYGNMNQHQNQHQHQRRY
ncbi:hypothetical protein EJ04DRAFT_40733 [Polyplosphaeria fusca]|uniref:Uncharacterized protein n=1 Tax=Polyplosphaeria fusca TaxID=682080 RepID=A0A9P4R8A7_9PLEO|nr:hypothetical protein EJ04DRAFT_40733 [Polyplosphaeria fusca]